MDALHVCDCVSAGSEVCADSVVLLAWLQIDKPWEEIYKSLPEPLYRHRYGT